MFRCYMEKETTEIKHLNYNRGNYGEIVRELELIDWNSNMQGKNTEEAWSNLADTLTQLMKAHIPVSKVKDSKDLPHVDREAITAIKTKEQNGSSIKIVGMK